jgi:hypothetical protein
MPPYHDTFHPVRRVGGQMVVVSNDDWTLIEDMNTVAGLAGETHRVLIGPEVFQDWDGAITDPATWQSAVEYDNANHRYLRIEDIRARLFRLIDQCPHITFCIETDRPGELVRMLPPVVTNMRIIDEMKKAGTWQWEGYRQNLWLGVGPIRTQADANRMIPEVLNVPEAVRYAVMEPREEIIIKNVNCGGCFRGADNAWACPSHSIFEQLGWLIIRGGRCQADRRKPFTISSIPRK